MTAQTIRALIVDDEAPARDRVRALLATAGDISIVGECTNGIEAVAAIRRERPALITLDIQMPGLDGFGVLSHLRADEMPVTIFVTAYDEHALRAFDVGAADYVLKPIQADRFALALARAIARISGDDGSARPEVSTLRHLRENGRYLDRIAIEAQGSMQLIPVGGVRWFEGADNYVRVHTGTSSHVLRITMHALEQQLDPARFMRVHRSAIVSFASVTRLERGRHGEGTLVLDDGTAVRVARTRATRLRLALRPQT
jgi:two-component system LytT family response regulator